MREYLFKGIYFIFIGDKNSKTKKTQKKTQKKPQKNTKKPQKNRKKNTKKTQKNHNDTADVKKEIFYW